MPGSPLVMNRVFRLIWIGAANYGELRTGGTCDQAAHMTGWSPKARDVRRLIKAARAEGLNPTAVEVDVKAGLIRVISGNPDSTDNDLDSWLEEHP